MIEIWWLSSKSMTIEVQTCDRVVVKTAPVAKKFLGQPLSNLEKWMSKQGGLRVEKLEIE